MLRADAPSRELREFCRMEQRDGRICALTVIVLLAMMADVLANQINESAYLRLFGGCLLLITLGAHLVEQRRLLDMVRSRLIHAHRDFEPAGVDPLTHVYSHRFLRDVVREKEAAVAAGHRQSLVLVDIDDLSGLNREHGRRKGDQVLEYTASLLKLKARAHDVVVRNDGDDFLLIVEGEDVHHLVSELRTGAEEGMVRYVVGTAVWDASRSFEEALCEAQDRVRGAKPASCVATRRGSVCGAAV